MSPAAIVFRDQRRPKCPVDGHERAPFIIPVQIYSNALIDLNTVPQINDGRETGTAPRIQNDKVDKYKGERFSSDGPPFGRRDSSRRFIALLKSWFAV